MYTIQCKQFFILIKNTINLVQFLIQEIHKFVILLIICLLMYLSFFRILFNCDPSYMIKNFSLEKVHCKQMLFLL